jgi:hypothetical protein
MSHISERAAAARSRSAELMHRSRKLQERSAELSALIDRTLSDLPD